MPQDAIEKLNTALAKWGGKYKSEIYEGALHGWTVPDSHAYNKPQAERAFANLSQLFTDRLQFRSDATAPTDLKPVTT